MKRYWWEHGKQSLAPLWWWRLGPVVVEFHADRLAAGVVASRWYVGVYLGPVVLTLGARHWVERQPDKWRLSFEKLEELVPPPHGGTRA